MNPVEIPKEVNYLISKVRKVFCSCQNEEQLKTAKRFSELAKKRALELHNNNDTDYFYIIDEYFDKQWRKYEL